MTIARKLLSVAGKAPIVSDYRRYYWSFFRNKTAVRGVFRSFAEAEAMISSTTVAGYDPPPSTPLDEISSLTAMRGLDVFEFRDYPTLFWLQRALSHGKRVLNIGGNVGLDYYSFRGRLPEVASTDWLVCEVPNIAAAGQRIAASRNEAALRFTSNIADGDGVDTIVCLGTLQYLPYNVPNIVSQWKRKPRVIIIGNTPARDGDGFVTVQNIGYAFVPYRVFSKAGLKSEFEAAGYQLLDEWRHPHRLSVPFAPTYTLDYYCGFAFGHGL